MSNRHSDQNTLYLPYGEEIYLNTGNGALTGNRYITAPPDGITIVHSSSGAITYEPTDTQHTATTDVAASNLAVTNRYYDPHGNPRGTTPTTWADPPTPPSENPRTPPPASTCSVPANMTRPPDASSPSTPSSNPATNAK